jgi:uncharacterized protein YprB with RNaseH-like and TPR domain
LDAYLDIETTGFIGGNSYPTVVGVAIDFPGDWVVEQLVGDNITPSAVEHVLEGVSTIYTFNGSSFDLPFLAWKPGVDLRRRFDHHDLMYACRRSGLRGGLKRIERVLGIDRQDLPEMDGYDAVLLWRKYLDEANTAALDLLLEYNRADVENLYALRNILQQQHDWRT